MRYVAAYLLANLGGNNDPSANDIKKILGSVGISVEDDKLELVLSSLKGKNINELIEAGKGKLAGIPSGAGGGVGAASGGGGAGAGGGDAGEAAPTEEKKEDKKEDSDSESDDDMGFGLFD